MCVLGADCSCYAVIYLGFSIYFLIFLKTIQQCSYCYCRPHDAPTIHHIIDRWRVVTQDV